MILLTNFVIIKLNKNTKMNTKKTYETTIELLIAMCIGILFGMILISLMSCKPNYKYVIIDSNNKTYVCDTFTKDSTNCIIFDSKSRYDKKLKTKTKVCGQCRIQRINKN